MPTSLPKKEWNAYMRRYYKRRKAVDVARKLELAALREHVEKETKK